jgi:hypothetical protein
MVELSKYNCLTFIRCGTGIFRHPFLIIHILANILVLVWAAIHINHHPVIAREQLQGLHPLVKLDHASLLGHFGLLGDRCNPVLVPIA